MAPPIDLERVTVRWLTVECGQDRGGGTGKRGNRRHSLNLDSHS
jgi:hypothetical protein